MNSIFHLLINSFFILSLNWAEAHETHKHKRKKRIGITCELLKKWKPPICRELSWRDRENILEKADPANFPFARFSSPPNLSKTIEKEVDCSHFIHEIYKRAGINFPYVTTFWHHCLLNFKKVPKEKALPGDLVLFKSHIGILNSKGKIISSGKGGRHNYSMLSPKHRKFIPSIRELKINAFGRPKSFLQWTCNN